MLKKISLGTLLISCILLSACTSNEEIDKEDMYLAGYVVDINDEYVEVVSTQGNYKFDITDAEVSSNDEIEIDDTCEIYYQEDLKDDDTIKATKVVEYFNGYLIGTISNANENTFLLTADGQSYTFENHDENVDLSKLDLSQIYDVEFDKKLSSQEINIANAIKLLEVDDAPNEEVEIVETFTGTMVD